MKNDIVVSSLCFFLWLVAAISSSLLVTGNIVEEILGEIEDDYDEEEEDYEAVPTATGGRQPASMPAAPPVAIPEAPEATKKNETPNNVRKTVTHGVIETCHAHRLYKHPVLKSFIKEGEVEGYENVEINYTLGTHPVLRVTTRDAETGEIIGGSDDSDGSTPGEIVIELDAPHLQYKKRLHDMMENFGFEKKHHEEVQKIIDKRTLEHAKEMKYRDGIIRDKHLRTIRDVNLHMELVEQKITKAKEDDVDPAPLENAMSKLKDRLHNTREALKELEQRTYNTGEDDENEDDEDTQEL